MIPYKIPNRNKKNCNFNYAFLKIQIWSEHTIRYLKGRFQSFKKLRVKINNCKDMKFTIY